MRDEQFEALYPDTTRDNSIKELISFVKNGNACQLIGIPGSGRSMTLGLLANNSKIRNKHLGNLQKDAHFVLVSFSEVRKRSLFDVMKFLFLSLADSLRLRKPEEYRKINVLLKKSLSFSDELVLFQALKEAIDYLALEKKMTIIMLFDRFEEYVPTVTEQFFINLKTLRARAKYQFTVVFSLNRPLESLLEPITFADFYEFTAGHDVYLSIFDQETTDFRVSYIEKITGKKIKPKLLEEIVKQVGGNGKLVKLGVECAIAGGEFKNVEQFLLSQKVIQATLLEIWRSFLPSEQTALKNSNYEDKDAREYLENVGVLKSKKIQIPLLESFVKANFSNSKQQKIIYEASTNTINCAEIIISDQLTLSEFRLLRYLLQNTGKIIERDEIINVVWSDVKSTAGITDQAVDQLIFRLRKKIEESSNKPRHLQTVKGRGFKFFAECNPIVKIL